MEEVVQVEVEVGGVWEEQDQAQDQRDSVFVQVAEIRLLILSEPLVILSNVQNAG
ncbi:unnamed protein product [marine sediment metagenome]|uniref:Uncharacterized protein n=1 Tax=marine sediment metagenome TaxID=412755 RepID=X0ZX53_9ZZZZ